MSWVPILLCVYWLTSPQSSVRFTAPQQTFARLRLILIEPGSLLVIRYTVRTRIFTYDWIINLHKFTENDSKSSGERNLKHFHFKRYVLGSRISRATSH